jgi:3-oxoacyl-[acyl-carrier-protein] synthase-3
VLHATCAHQGLDHFASASYVQSHTVGGDATAVEIRQFSNGCIAGLDLAASTLTARAGERSALVTTSDRFVPPAYDRFASDKGVVFGDGGTALVVSRRPGALRLLSTSLIGDSSFVRMQIGDAAWTEAAGQGGWPVDLGARRAQNVRRQGVELLMELMVAGADRQREVIELALADAEVKVDEVAWWVMPNMGRAIVDWEFRRSLGVRESQTTWSWGREVGHLGAGDQFAGLCHLLETGAVRPGDRLVTTGIGQGENYGCAVVEVVEVPQWSITAS